MAFIDGTVVNVALARVAAGTQCQRRRRAMGHRSLFPFALRSSPRRRFVRRPVRTSPNLPPWHRFFASASAWPAVSLRQSAADRRPGGAGNRRGAARPRESGHHQQRVPDSRSVVAPSGRGRVLARSPQPSVQCWAAGLIEHVSWRAVFSINLPLALVVIVISLWRVPGECARGKTTLDWWGAILGVLGLGALVYGLIESSRLGFARPVGRDCARRGRRCSPRAFPDHRGENFAADVAARALSLPHLYRREPAHLSPLRRAWRRPSFFSR